MYYTRRVLLGLVSMSQSLLYAAESPGKPTVEISNGKNTLVEQLANADYGDTGDLVLQMYLRDIQLTDTFFAKVSGSKVYFPLAELATLLRFPIVVDVVGKQAAGWFIDPSQTFKLDIQTKTILIGGKSVPFHENSFLEDEFDLYVDTETLKDWFGLFFDFSLLAQRVSVRSLQTLPAELERQRSGREVLQEVVFGAVKPFSIPKYQIVDWPSLAVNLGGYFSNQQTYGNYDYSVQALGDLALMNGRLTASGSGRSIDSVRLTLGRKNPAGMVGPLDIIDFEAGDTSQFLPGLIGSSLSGRGLKFSNKQLSTRRDFDKIDLQGELLQGYEVELYANNRLMGVVRSPENGLYRFDDIPLRTGQNELRLEFYGAQGQRRTETQRSFVGSGQNLKGQLTYEFGLLQSNRLVFENIGDLNNSDPDTNNNLSGALQISYGLSRRATLGVTLASLAPDNNSRETTPDVSSNQTYTNLRLGTDILGYLLSTNVTMDNNSNLAGSLKLRTRLGSYDVNMSQIIYSKDYRKLGEHNTEVIGPRTSTTAGLNRSFRSSDSGGAFSWGLTGGYLTTLDNARTTSTTLRSDYSKGLLGGSWSHTYARNLDDKSQQNSGQTGLRFRPNAVSSWNWRASLNYAYPSESIVQGASLSVGRSFSGGASLALNASRDIEGKSNRYSASWQKRFQRFNFNSTLTGSSSDDVFLRMGLSFNAGRSPESKFPKVYSGSASSARVAAIAFVDENNNRNFDEGESPVHGVRLTRNGLATNAVTKENGYALLEDLSPRVSSDIDVIYSGIKDPSLRAVPIEKGILPRPGRLPVLEIPFVRTTDLEGSVLLSDKTPAPNVRLLLRPTDGGEPLVVQTEFDGVYYLSGIPLGEYELGPDEEQLKSVGLHTEPATKLVTFTDSETLLEPQNFELIRGARVPMQQTAEAQVDNTVENNTAETRLLVQKGDISSQVTLDVVPNNTPLIIEQPQPTKSIERIATRISTNTHPKISELDTQRSLTALNTEAQINIDSYSDTEPELAAAKGVSDSESDGKTEHIATYTNDVTNQYNLCSGTSIISVVSESLCTYGSSIIRDIKFTIGSASVSTDSASALNALSRVINANPNLKFTIRTHTDNRGTPESNLTLTIDRTTNILRYLLDHGKIVPNQLAGYAYGDRKPIASNKTAAGRATNRRVEVTVSR